MVLDPSGDANAIEIAPTLVFRINVQGLFKKRTGCWKNESYLERNFTEANKRVQGLLSL